jgi:eukaryotic-like serine/threonine-protein kinase
MPASSNMPASSIGRFKVIRVLGRGGQGEVVLAEDTQLGRQVAIKILHSQSREKIESLLHEARIVSQLQHPNIVPLYDAGEQLGAPYLVYAYIEGGTLAAMLTEGPLPPVKSAEIACALLEALEYAHAHGVMHLDLKPSNIMMGQRGQPMLMDFGIARLMSEPGEQDESMTGTPQYMAPERISGEGVDARVDIFSLGAVLYEMVTGQPAYSGDDRFQVMNRIVHEKIATPSSLNLSVDSRLEEIILKSMARAREDRYSNAAAMRVGLKAYLEAAAIAGAADAHHSTLQFLLRRMRGKNDFPALSHIITEINNIVSSETQGSSKLARVILQDFALTNKLLRLVNTVSFGQFGGKINTISK